MDTNSPEDLLERIRAASRNILEETIRQREQHQSRSQAYRELREQAEQARRSGEQGRDWQILQQRIDMNQTTFNDVICGRDLSDEARAVREQIKKMLPDMRGAFEESSLEYRDEIDEAVRVQRETIADMQEGLDAFRSRPEA